MTTNIASAVTHVLQLMAPWGSGKAKEESHAEVLQLILMEQEHFAAPVDRMQKVFRAIDFHTRHVNGAYVADALEALFVRHYATTYDFLTELRRLVSRYATDPDGLEKAYLWYKSAVFAVLGAKVWAEKAKVQNTTFDLDFPRLFGGLLCQLGRTTIAGGSRLTTYGEAKKRLGSYSNDLSLYFSCVHGVVSEQVKESERRARAVLSILIGQDFRGLAEGEGGSIIRDVMHKLLSLLTLSDQVSVFSKFFGVDRLIVPLDRGNVYAVVKSGTVNLRDAERYVFASPEDARRYVEFIETLDTARVWRQMNIALIPSCPEEKEGVEGLTPVLCALNLKRCEMIRELARLRILNKCKDLKLEDLELEFGTKNGAITFNWKKPAEEIPF